MNDDASPPSLLTIAPRPEKTFITDKLSHPATVLHPTFSGDMKQFDVTVESVFNREEDGETRLAFRGKASSGNWSGYKTFFADACERVVDGTTGRTVDDVSMWLLDLHDEITPMRFSTLINEVTLFLQKDMSIVIGNTEITIAHKTTTITFTDIVDTTFDEVDDADDECSVIPPFKWLSFCLNDVCIHNADDIVCEEAIKITIYANADDTRSLFYRETGPFPEATLECSPSAGARINVRKIENGSARSLYRRR